MAGLSQNVGHFNKEMMSTSMGKYINLQNKLQTELVDLGANSIYLRIELTRLKLAFMPLASVLIRITSAIIGIPIKALNGAMKLLKTPLGDLNIGMKTLSILLRTVVGLFGVLLSPIIITGIAIEDFWTYLQGGDSIIGRLIEGFKNLGTAFKEGFLNNKIVQTLMTAYKMMKKIRESDEDFDIPKSDLIPKVDDNKIPQPAQSEVGKKLLDVVNQDKTDKLKNSVFFNDGAIQINLQGGKNDEETAKKISEALRHEWDTIAIQEGIK